MPQSAIPQISKSKKQLQPPTHKDNSVPWLGTLVEQHNRGQQRVLEEQIAYVRSTQKSLEKGLVKNLDSKAFRHDLIEMAINKLQQNLGTNNQSIVVKKDDLAKVMKKNLLKNRSITQPKLLKAGSIPSIE